MNRRAQTPTFAIVIEWENARFAELERTRRMLRRLRDEISSLPSSAQPPEVVLLYDRFTIDGDVVTQVVDEYFRSAEIPAVTRIIATDGLRYYQQKNRGAAETRGDIIIFLDCDVIPERGWLAALLESFENPAVEAVGGETYVELTGLFSKAFALFWFFNLRDPAGGLVPAGAFHANNVAFRREMFLATPFPEAPAYRAQCVLLGADLCARGRGVFRQKAARASHPYPLGLTYFVARALHNGRDTVLVQRLRGDSRAPSWGSAFAAYRANLKDTYGKIRREYRNVSLSRAGAVGAFAIALVYFSLRLIGELVTRKRPDLIAQLMPI